MGGLLELSFLSSTRSITTTVSEYRYGWPPERYLPSFCGSNLEKAEDTMKVRSKWRPTAIIYLTTRAVIAEQRARKTCFLTMEIRNIFTCIPTLSGSILLAGPPSTFIIAKTMLKRWWSASSSGSRLSGDHLLGECPTLFQPGEKIPVKFSVPQGRYLSGTGNHTIAVIKGCEDYETISKAFGI
ncbi:hypothetical protein EMCRGX_G023078 [Ephydatia muelleri]